MITVAHGSNTCHLDSHSYFRLSYGVRPSFGRFTMGASEAQAAVTAGTSAALQLHNTTLYNIYPVKCEVGDALSPSIGRIFFADERVMWPFYQGTQDYNTYKANSALARDITGSEKDFDLDNLNSRATVDLIDGGGGNDQIKIAGDHTATFTSGTTLKLEGSSEPLNDGTYIVSSSSYSSPNTTIDIPTDSLEDDTATGGTTSAEWTFIEIFAELFGFVSVNYTLQLQAVGGAAPTREPRNIRGKNITVPEILQQLLAQANCFLAVDLLTDPPHYQVIPIGDEDVWQSAITYRIGEVSTLAGERYRSLQNANINKDPSSETDWWAILLSHNIREIIISPKSSRSSTAKMLASKPFFDDDGFYETQGAASSIGGTGEHFVPSPYEAFYAGSTLKNSSFLGNMGDELTAEYKLSFLNAWYDIRYAGSLPLSLGRGAQEITWELTGQEGFTTRIRSFRPREESFPVRHTLFAHDKYWVNDGSVVRAFVKTTPGATTSVDVYLRKDFSDIEVTVECYIYGGGNLEDAFPTLVSEMPLYVQYDSAAGEWKNVTDLYKIAGSCNES